MIKRSGHYVKELRTKTPTLEQRVGNLSGGNQQKVVLAKWLSTNPRILILDEATSSVDTQTEQIIQEALARLLRGRTAFVIEVGS